MTRRRALMLGAAGIGAAAGLMSRRADAVSLDLNQGNVQAMPIALPDFLAGSPADGEAAYFEPDSSFIIHKALSEAGYRIDNALSGTAPAPEAKRRTSCTERRQLSFDAPFHLCSPGQIGFLTTKLESEPQIGDASRDSRGCGRAGWRAGNRSFTRSVEPRRRFVDPAPVPDTDIREAHSSTEHRPCIAKRGLR